jgi:RNA polymerase sigma-70 factor (ECF subfamily)
MSISLGIKSLLGYAAISDISNESLMSRYAAKKEKQILAQLYDNCSRDLYHFLLTLSDAELANDIAQKTWLKVIDKSHLYQNSGNFKSWLFTLGRRTLIDEFRKLQRFDELQEQDVPIDDRAPDQSLEKEQLDAAFEDRFTEALSKLPFLQKEAFCLQQEGFSLHDIAHMTYSEIETVKSRLRYAKSSLRRNLEEHDD